MLVHWALSPLLIHFCFLFHSLDSSFSIHKILLIYSASFFLISWNDFFSWARIVYIFVTIGYLFSLLLPFSSLTNVSFTILSFKTIFFRHVFNRMAYKLMNDWWKLWNETIWSLLRSRYYFVPPFISFSNLLKSKLSIDLRLKIIKIDPYRWIVWVSTRCFAPIKK